MVEIFNEGDFSSYRVEDSRYSNILAESRSFSTGGTRLTKPMVFLSHSHKDLDDLKGFIGYLERNYGINCYIDSEDPGMPEKTSGDTATRIKKAIEMTNRFILLATDKAIASQWCNWELGYGDAQKFQDKIAILPMKNAGRLSYSGNEYMQIYPCIVRVDGSDITPLSRLYHPEFPTTAGYYVVSGKYSGTNSYEPLYSWLHR